LAFYELSGGGMKVQIMAGEAEFGLCFFQVCLVECLQCSQVVCSV